MTTVRIAQTEPWPGQRLGGDGFRVSSFLVVLVDDTGGRALPIWLNGPEGHGLTRGRDDHPLPEPAEAITAELLRAAGVTVTGVDIDELDTALTTGPRRGRPDPAQASTRIGFTAAGSAEPRQMTVRIGYALALAGAAGAPVRITDQLMDQLAVPAQDDLVSQFTTGVPLPRPGHGRLARLFHRHPPARPATR
jgi:bifunctional DNase/RNase